MLNLRIRGDTRPGQEPGARASQSGPQTLPTGLQGLSCGLLVFKTSNLTTQANGYNEHSCGCEHWSLFRSCLEQPPETLRK